MEISTDQIVFMLRAAQEEGVGEGKKDENKKAVIEAHRAADTYTTSLAFAREEVARDALSIMQHAKEEVLKTLGRSKHRQAIGWLLDESCGNLQGLSEGMC